MKRKIIPVLILTILAFTTVIPVAAMHHEKPVVVAHLKGAIEPDTQLDAMMNNITYIDWKVVLGDITSSDLSGASTLLMSLSDSSITYTSAELSAIESWMSEGGKTIYISSDSDYGTDHLRQAQANAVLEAIDSRLRIDDCSAEDAVSNGGAPYRVLGVSTNVAPEMEFLVRGVERGLFHGPGIIVGYEEGEYIDLSSESMDDVYVIMTTSETGIVVDNSEPAPNVMEAGSEGEFPLMVAEIDYVNGNTIIAVGEAPFDQYMGLYAPEMLRADRYGADANPQQGEYLVKNILKYSTVFNSKILTQASEIIEQEAEIESLNENIESLNTEVSDLESEVSTLESQVTSLETDLEAAQSSASTMQLAAVAALVIGIVVGYFVGPMVKKE